MKQSCHAKMQYKGVTQQTMPQRINCRQHKKNEGQASIIIPLMLSTFMAALDNSIANVSLPVMQQQFKVQVDDIQWVIRVYMLAFCVFMPLTNWLKDKIGLYKMYLISIVNCQHTALKRNAVKLRFIIDTF